MFTCDKKCTNVVLLQGKTTPLHIAVSKGNYEGVQMLIKAGANLNATDKVRKFIYCGFIIT